MHLDIYKSIWFKFVVMINIVILVSWPLPSFKFTGVQETENFYANYPTKFSIDLDGIWYSLDTC